MNIYASQFIPEELKKLSFLECDSIHYANCNETLGYINAKEWKSNQSLFQFLFTVKESGAHAKTTNPNPNQHNPNPNPNPNPTPSLSNPNPNPNPTPSLSKNWALKLFEWIEKERNERAVRFKSYELFQTIKIKTSGGGYQIVQIEVPGLADADPPILVGDWVSITYLDYDQIPRLARTRASSVSRVKSQITCPWPEELYFDRHCSFIANVKIFENELFYQRQVEALIEASTIPNLDKILYPSTCYEISQTQINTSFVTSNLNPVQKQFVNLSLKDTLVQPPPIKILFGPPGTGKTMVAVETTLQILLQANQTGKKVHILVCAPSVSAADTLALRLSTKLPSSSLFRLNDGTRRSDGLPNELLGYCSVDPMTGLFNFPAIDTFLSYSVVVCTCKDAAIIKDCGLGNQDLMNAQKTYLKGFQKLGVEPNFNIQFQNHWTHLIVDEAGQASECEMLIPITTAWSMDLKVYLFGDPKQLPCAVYEKSNIATPSLLERLLNHELYSNKRLIGKITIPYNPELVVLLSHNYRSHASLLMMPSVLFYHDNLLACGDSNIINRAVGFKSDQDTSVLGFDWPVYFVNVNGQDIHSAFESDSLVSWANREEAVQVEKYATQLLLSGIAQSQADIGVISPFRGQVGMIRSRLRKANLGGINVGTILDFQGKEYPIIIVSCVSSINALKDNRQEGVINHPKELNVALTRARSLLVVIGYQELLEKDPWFRQFILFCHRHKRTANAKRLKPVPPLLETDFDCNLIPDLRYSLQSGLEKRWLSTLDLE